MEFNYSISSVDIKNATLATPFTKEGRVRLGKTFLHKDAPRSVFLENCYVDADFISQSSLVDKINSRSVEYALSDTQDYDYFASDKDTQIRYRYRIKRRTNQAQKEHFEKDLLGTDMKDLEHRTYSTIFLIEGPAGSGKTTYANHLIGDDNFVFDVCDFETATQKSCSLFSKVYNFKQLQLNPITAIEMLLLSRIHMRLAKAYDEPEENYRYRLSQICEIYHAQFNSSRIATKDTEDFRKFFTCLESFCIQHIDYEQLSSNIYTQINDIILASDSIIGSDEYKKRDSIYAIEFLLGILMRTYFCLSQISGVKHILFIDNIERYILSESGKPYIIIFDVELQKIINSIYSIADETEDLLYNTFDEIFKVDKNITYKTSFGILVAVRESTLNLLRSNHTFAEYFEQHHAENYPTYVNITNWFDYYKIFLKKVNFFLGITDEQENIFTHTFNNILNDVTLSKWSLRSLLLNMFNNNFRRFFANLTEVFCNYEDAVKYYNRMWDKVKNDPLAEARHTRHMCRKIIIRIVLDYMQNVKNIEDYAGFFDCLMARYDEDTPYTDKVAKASYARRILTYLDNMNNLQESRPVSFPELIKVLLHKPIIKSINKSNVSINDPRINDIANILTFASQTAKINTNGVELVAINVDSVQFGRNPLAEIIKSQWNAYRTSGVIDSATFNIKITSAGSVFAMLFPTFEYFACRYKNNSIPLFMLKSEEEREKLLFGVKKSTPNALPDDEIGIFYKAINCIDAVIKFETRFLSLNLGKNTPMSSRVFAKPAWLYDYHGEGVGMVHALRIICDHLGYLQDYRNFLAGADDSYDNKHYKDGDGQGVIDNAIERYKIKYSQIVKDYRTYLEVGRIPNIS